MKLSGRIAALVICGIMIGGTAIGWRVYRHRLDERGLIEAARICRAQAERGDAKAESRLGYLYSQGQGVPQSYVEALRWRRAAAEQNDPGGEDGVAYMYSHGQGAQQDYSEALRWYGKAAKQSDAIGERGVGFLYSKGEGVQQDDSEAVRWYRQSAGQGDASAEYDLGLMYYYGRGVTQDRGEADRWFHRAAEQGNESAERFLGLKATGPSTSSKIDLSVAILGCLILLGGSLSSKKGWNTQRRRTLLAALIGLCFVAVALYGSYHFGRLQPGVAINVFNFFKHGLAGVFIVLLMSEIYSKREPPRARVALVVIGACFASFNIFALAHFGLRYFVPALRMYCLVNGLLIGMAIPLAFFLWRAGVVANSEQMVTAEADSLRE